MLSHTLCWQRFGVDRLILMKNGTGSLKTDLLSGSDVSRQVDSLGLVAFLSPLSSRSTRGAVYPLH